MSATRTIKAKELVKDIRSGMTDFDLMEKYKLDPPSLDRLLRHLVDADLVTQGQLEERSQLSDSQITRAFVESLEDSRKLD
jgi:hypothetical protein